MIKILKDMKYNGHIKILKTLNIFVLQLRQGSFRINILNMLNNHQIQECYNIRNIKNQKYHEYAVHAAYPEYAENRNI